MGILKWGKPHIQIGKVGSDGSAPATWIDVDNPVQDTTQLTTNDGNTHEALGEGGELVDFKQEKNRYEFAFELFVKKGVPMPVEDVDGVVDGHYAMRLTLEDETIEGIQFSKSTIAAKDTYNTADGQRKPYVMRVINETDGTKTIKPYIKATTGNG